MKMMAKRMRAGRPTLLVTAAHPTSGGMAPAAPPMTMFCGVVRFSHRE